MTDEELAGHMELLRKRVADKHMVLVQVNSFGPAEAVPSVSENEEAILALYEWIEKIRFAIWPVEGKP